MIQFIGVIRVAKSYTYLDTLLDGGRDVVEADGALHEGQHGVRVHRTQVDLGVHHLGAGEVGRCGIQGFRVK